MTKTLADITEEERTEFFGIWCEDTSGALCIYMGDARGFGVGAYPASRCTMSSFFDELTPRYDLPRAWQADGTPPAGKWEHAERLSMGVTTVYLCGKENPTHRQWIGKWEQA